MKENPYQYRQESIKKDFELVDKVAHFMDEQYTIPGTRFKFGWDPILNFIPYLGDIFGTIISVILVVMMSKHGVSSKVIVKMLLNVFLDFIIGAIPILGYFGDFIFKANTRNIDLLKSHYYEGKNQGSGAGIILVILTIFFILFIVALYLLYKAFSFSYNIITSSM